MTASFQHPIHTTQAVELPGNHHILETTRGNYKRESQFAQLPPEVLLLIIDHLDRAEKVSLLVTCSYLRRLSEPLLYRNLDPDGNWKSRQRIQLFRTLGERHDLLPHIRSFRGHLIPTSIARPSQPTQEIDLWHWDSRATALLQDEWFAISAPLFLQAINIRYLDFTDNIDWQEGGRWERFSRVVSGMKLQSLALSSTSQAPLDFTPILRGQPELARLELTCPTAHFDGLQEADAPKLKVFKGTWRQAEMIVPGRPVGRLDLGCVSEDDCQCNKEAIFQKLLQSSDTIREFKAGAHRRTDGNPLKRMLQLIIQHLPELVDLTMIAGGEIRAQDLLDEIPKLSMIRSLMILDAWIIFTNSPFGLFSGGSNHMKINTWEELLGRLKELCPSLNDVGYTQQEEFFMCGM
ncbi:hypothetical protein FRC04_012247 [Tulasnella sp. 424]|nr:hypothetical protein FRC04_012247 [Tulasnella sp. 424]KAG8973732.1 hypothetical protein FRC05_008320 [Tulasnella sp. 425]